MTFVEFVVIRLKNVSEKSIEYKSMASFIGAVRGKSEMSIEELLNIWICCMIDRGIAISTRKRYVEKLNTIYKSFNNSIEHDADPFDKIRPLRDLESISCSKDIQEQSLRLDVIFNRIMEDAKTNPTLALFLYLLFNVSSDIKSAVMLRTDEYAPTFDQLNDINAPSTFHHRRRYVFSLNQSRKRVPQLVNEVLGGITDYLSQKGIKFDSPFTPTTIVTLWAVKARKSGVSLPVLKSMLKVVPSEFEYLKFVKGVDMTQTNKLHIKEKVAEAFAPVSRRWFAAKLRRGIEYKQLHDYLKDKYPDSCTDSSFFYPKREVAKRLSKKVVKERIPVIPYVVFLNVQPKTIEQVDLDIKNRGYGWVFKTTNVISADYAVISKRDMLNFQRMIGVVTPDMNIELTQAKPTSIGREVRITGGFMAGYEGGIYDIKETPEVRNIYIKLSDKYFIKGEVKIEEIFVEPISE